MLGVSRMGGFGPHASLPDGRHGRERGKARQEEGMRLTTRPGPENPQASLKTAMPCGTLRIFFSCLNHDPVRSVSLAFECMCHPPPRFISSPIEGYGLLAALESTARLAFGIISHVKSTEVRGCSSAGTFPGSSWRATLRCQCSVTWLVGTLKSKCSPGRSSVEDVTSSTLYPFGGFSCGAFSPCSTPELSK